MLEGRVVKWRWLRKRSRKGNGEELGRGRRKWEFKMSSGNTKCKAESVKRKWKRNCDGK
jgi:hypothetical protein